MSGRREAAVNAALAGLLLGVPLAAAALGEPFVVTLATKVAILALAGVGLNLALGLGGLVSFGHAAFFGVGGYVAGILATHGVTQMPAIWLVAVAAAGAAALAIGALSLRTSGVYFIMITLAFAQMLFYFAISWPAYGGEDGLSFYVRNGFPGLNTLRPLPFFAICAGLLLAAIALAAVLAGSRFGMALQGARQNPVRMAALGIRPYGIRLTAFVLSGMITGLAGALYADLNRFVSPAMLSWQTSGEIMVLVILGGVGRLFGPVAGAGLFVLCEHLLGGVSEHWLFFLGLILLAVVLLAPGGVVGIAAPRAAAGRHG